MKKSIIFMLIIISVVVFIGCNPFGTTVTFTPPSWIIGTWADAYDINTYVFETDNITYTTTGSSIDFYTFYNSVESSVSEDSSSSLYEVTITSEGSTSVYRFEKTSETTLNYTITTSGISAGPIELVKSL